MMAGRAPTGEAVKNFGRFKPNNDAIKIPSTHASRGPELPVVGQMPAEGEDENEEARLFYVAATRATQRLVIGVGGDGWFGVKFA